MLVDALHIELHMPMRLVNLNRATLRAQISVAVAAYKYTEIKFGTHLAS